MAATSESATDGAGLDVPGGWKALFGRLADGGDLTAVEAAAAVDEILGGRASDGQIGALLMALRMKGVTVAELTGMVDAMLANAAPIELPAGVDPVDLVGTGGAPPRRVAAVNVSTMACFVVAGAGATVCKHGNRRASSTSGSTDLLEALGVPVELDGEAVARCVVEAGIGFCFARAFHPAMRHVGPVRAELGIPTVFNLLGPLSHPARVRRQVIGVSDPALVELVVGVLQARAVPHAAVVHGHGDLDELALSGPSTLHEIHDGDVRVHRVDPASLGLPVVAAAELGGGGPQENAALARSVLAGAPGPVADLVALNAAAGLLVAGVATDLADGLARAREAISSGAAAAALERLVAVAREAASSPSGS